MSTKNHPSEWFFECVLFDQNSEVLVYKTQAHGQVTSSNQLAAGLTKLVFGNSNTVTGFAAVAVNSKTVLANT
jgi:hypothetical protein